MQAAVLQQSKLGFFLFVFFLLLRQTEMRNRDAGQPRWQYLLWNFSKCLYDIWLSASHGFVMWRSMSHAQNAVEERVHSNILYAWKRKVKVRLNYETQKLHNFFLQAYSLFLSLSLSLS